MMNTQNRNHAASGQKTLTLGPWTVGESTGKVTNVRSINGTSNPFVSIGETTRRLSVDNAGVETSDLPPEKQELIDRIVEDAHILTPNNLARVSVKVLTDIAEDMGYIHGAVRYSPEDGEWTADDLDRLARDRFNQLDNEELSNGDVKTWRDLAG